MNRNERRDFSCSKEAREMRKKQYPLATVCIFKGLKGLE
jgi:hypothetical protein